MKIILEIKMKKLKRMTHELDLPESSDLEAALKKAIENNCLPTGLNMRTAKVTRGSETLFRYNALNDGETVLIEEYSVE